METKSYKERDKEEVLVRVENIQQNIKVVQNIFDSMKSYWIGDSSEVIQELYKSLQEEICVSNEFLDCIKEELGGDNIKKLPGNIF